MDNNFAIESFIEYCDSMMIANESASNIDKEYTRYLDHLQKIQDKIDNEMSFDKTIKLLEEEKRIISHVRSKVSSESDLDIKDVCKMVKSTILPVSTAILSIIGARSKKFKFATGAASIALVSGTVSKITIQEIKNTKKHVIQNLDMHMEEIDNLIKMWKRYKSEGYKDKSEVAIPYDDDYNDDTE